MHREKRKLETLHQHDLGLEFRWAAGHQARAWSVFVLFCLSLFGCLVSLVCLLFVACCLLGHPEKISFVFLLEKIGFATHDFSLPVCLTIPFSVLGFGLGVGRGNTDLDDGFCVLCWLAFGRVYLLLSFFVVVPPLTLRNRSRVESCSVVYVSVMCR